MLENGIYWVRRSGQVCEIALFEGNLWIGIGDDNSWTSEEFATEIVGQRLMPPA